MRRQLAMLLAGSLLAGCATLPASGPTTAAIEEAALATGSAAPQFRLVDVSLDVADRLQVLEQTPTLSRLANDPPDSGPRIAVGDTLQIALYEPTSGGLFSGAAGVGGGAASQVLPAQMVAADGSIRIPFAGDVRVAGLTEAEASRRVEAALRGQAIEPQALVVSAQSPQRSVTVLGDAVGGGGRVPLSGAGERLLDVVAMAGGFSRPLHEVTLRLTRGAETAEILAAALVSDPAQNVAVRPRDVIAIEHRPRHFVALGATGQNSQIVFGQQDLTLSEALGKAAGLLDARADATGVFVARRESATAGTEPAAAQAIIYRLDLTQPAALLAAQRFPMRDRDVLFVANARITPLEKTLRLVALALSPLNALLIVDSVSN